MMRLLLISQKPMEAILPMRWRSRSTRYLEAALKTEAKTADDYCERGKVYYYMQDYDNARTELTTASEKGSTEAALILGMVYMAQGDTANARSFYQQYIDADGEDPAKGYNGLALCDIADGDYDSALQNISQGLGDATSDEMRDLLFNEIVVYEKKLDFSTALSKAQEYVQTFKDDEAAAKELTFLQSRVGNQAAATDTSEADTSGESTSEEAADTGVDESSEESY